jgi:surfeit locus 1 family protein
MKKLDARSWGFLFVAVIAAAIFLRLGTWQLDRLTDRRADNARRQVLAALPPLQVSGSAELPPLDSLLWRRVHLTGEWDFGKEIIIRGRAAYSSPGVHVVTPLRLENGQAFLVLRGWLPAADGLSADIRAARPSTLEGADAVTVQITGLALPGEPSSALPPRWKRFDGSRILVLGSLDFDSAERGFGETLVHAWLLPDSLPDLGASSTPRPVQPPAPSDGPHLAYAIQWFGFAAITIAGAIVFLRTRRRTDSERSTA